MHGGTYCGMGRIEDLSMAQSDTPLILSLRCTHVRALMWKSKTSCDVGPA